MEDLNRAINAEVSKLLKWESETSAEEAEVEAELKAAEEQTASQEITQLHLLQERDKQRDLLRQTKHAR